MSISLQRKYKSTAFGFLGDWKEFNPNDKKDWPEKGVSGVYIIYDDNEYPIYVGKSADSIRSRLKDHSQKKWWVRKILGHSKYVTIEDNEYIDHKRMLINDVEKVLIKSLSPIINRKM